MKQIIYALACALCAAGIQAATRGPDVPDYPVDRITDKVYVIHGPLQLPNPENRGFMNNPGIVLTSDGPVVIDPGSSVQVGEMVLRAVKKLTDRPVAAVFITHVHGDHWLGNQAIVAAVPNVPIYAHRNTIDLIDSGAGRMWVNLMEQMTQESTLGTGVTPPNRPVGNGDNIRIGDTHFRIHSDGPAHTTSDIMIEVVEQHTVFLGDNVTNGRLPRIDGGSVGGDIKACREILETGATHYVPGHGKSGGPEVVKAMQTYLEIVYDSVRTLYEEGLSDYEMKDAIRAKLKDYAGWEDFDGQLGKHISQAYLEIEAAQF
jgi:glyoxylase-like metal-dependent hydrolase (beta-lactamase superfamily II)